MSETKLVNYILYITHMDNNVQITGYEEIAECLRRNGFEDRENEFVKEIHNKQIMIINGHQTESDDVKTIVIKKLGKGQVLNFDETIELETLWGFSFVVQDMPQYDIWVRDWKEFRELSNN